MKCTSIIQNVSTFFIWVYYAGDEVVWIECVQDQDGEDVCVQIERPTTGYVTQNGGFAELWMTEDQG